MEKTTTSKRLCQIMNERNIKQVDILKLCEPYCRKHNVKLNKNDLSQYVSGKVEPRQDKLSILAMALNVNEVWLMGYDVDPSNNKLLSHNETILINHYRSLNDTGKQKASEYIEDLTLNPKYIQEAKKNSV